MTRKLQRGIPIVVATTIMIAAFAVWWRPQPDVKAAMAVPRLPKVSPEPLKGPDYGEIFGQTADSFVDNERGIQHFIDVVRSRKLAP